MILKKAPTGFFRKPSRCSYEKTDFYFSTLYCERRKLIMKIEMKLETLEFLVFHCINNIRQWNETSAAIKDIEHFDLKKVLEELRDLGKAIKETPIKHYFIYIVEEEIKTTEYFIRKFQDIQEKESSSIVRKRGSGAYENMNLEDLIYALEDWRHDLRRVNETINWKEINEGEANERDYKQREEILEEISKIKPFVQNHLDLEVV